MKTKYHAWVTQAEHDAITRVLADLPRPEAAPGWRLAWSFPTHKAPAPRPRRRSRSVTPSGRSGRGHAYANCDAVRAAGKAPLHRGTPDYAANPQLDRDDDGVACE